MNSKFFFSILFVVSLCLSANGAVSRNVRQNQKIQLSKAVTALELDYADLTANDNNLEHKVKSAFPDPQKGKKKKKKKKPKKKKKKKKKKPAKKKKKKKKKPARKKKK